MKKRILCTMLALTLCLGLAMVPAAAAASYLDSGAAELSKLTKAEIVQLLEDNPLDLPDKIFDVEPSATAPYSTGKVNTAALQAAVNRLNALRRIAGLKPVTLDADLSANAQYGAVIQAVYGSLNHYPAQPADMSDSFYQQAYQASSSSNLYAGRTLTTAMDNFMDDSDAGNIDRLGHRRWQLNPALGKLGLGYAVSNTRYGSYVAEKVLDRSAPSYDYDFIAWPASGNFPTNTGGFGRNTAWSVSLSPSKYAIPSRSDLTVTLTRESDGQTWTFRGSDSYTASSSGKYFNLDTANYGIANCIVFRPDGITKYEGLYTVAIDGIRTRRGSPIDFSYQVDFFDTSSYSSTEPEQPTVPTQPEKPTVPTQPEKPTVPTKPEKPGDLTLVASGNSTTAKDYAVLADGRLVNWSNGSVLGTGYQAVSFAENRYMGLKTDGTLWAWGEWYALSDDTITTPVKVLSNVKQISGYLALKEDGSVWSPAQIEGMNQQQDGVFYKVMDGAAQISNYQEDSGLAVTADGKLYSWGSNWFSSYLGRETENSTSNPPAVILDQVSYVNGHFAIRKDGSLWSWGSNTYGTVGNNGSGTVITPIKVMDNVVGAWVDGDTLSAVRTSDGRLWTWGMNSEGELGHSSFDRYQNYGLAGIIGGPGTPYQSTPVSVALDQVVQVTGGGYEITLALKADGTLWAAGKGYGSTFVKVLDGVMVPGQTGASGQPSTNQPSSEQPSSWAQSYVKAAIEAGIVPTELQDKYTQVATRGEFCALAVQLYETATGKTVTDRVKFVDTTDANVEKAAALGVIGGVGDGRADPNGTLTREQAAVMLTQLARVCGKPLSASGISFADSGSVAGWAADAVDRVASNGIMSGTGGNSFSPKVQYSREQSITTMLGLFNYLK